MSSDVHNQRKIPGLKVTVNHWLLLVAALLCFNIYLFTHYSVGPATIEKLSFSSNLKETELLVYASQEHSNTMDFSHPIQPRLVDGQFHCDLGMKIRKFRIYIVKDTDSVILNNVKLLYADRSESLPANEFNTDKLRKITPELYASELSAFFELKKSRITVPELVLAEILILLFCLPLVLFMTYLYARSIRHFYVPFHLKSFGVGLYLFSIFLPLPFFNIGFMISFALIVMDFDYRRFLAGKLGLLVLVYFLWFVISNVFVSESFNMKLFETMLPFFFLPFYIACLPQRHYLWVFPVAALIFSLYFLLTSFIDYSFFRNVSVFSFDGFTKYVHPVYFSYLLVFSIMYLELSDEKHFNKWLFLPVLGLALLCCGSKLMIVTTGLFYALQLFKTKPYVGYAFIAIAVAAVLVFAPTRKRFQEIVNPKSFSILKEDPIVSKNDERLTGVTVRLIIWQESLETFNTVKQILFGQGVDQAADHLLQNRLASRNVDASHIKYDPHNQYITTFYKLGSVGLLILLAICAYVFRVARSRHNRLLLFSALLFIIAMFTESVLQRATGIFFFITIFLLQTFLIFNPTHLENSNPGDQGNS